jgi:hypothetical protein
MSFAGFRVLWTVREECKGTSTGSAQPNPTDVAMFNVVPACSRCSTAVFAFAFSQVGATVAPFR